MIERSVTHVFLTRLDRGDDLVETLTALARTRSIRAAWIQGIGAFDRAVLGYYDEATAAYLRHDFERFTEVLVVQGNISIKDGEPFVHLHATLADSDGHAHGGHVMPGCRVFAMELAISVLGGADPVREPDAKTGLSLWPLPARPNR